MNIELVCFFKSGRELLKMHLNLNGHCLKCGLCLVLFFVISVCYIFGLVFNVFAESDGIYIYRIENGAAIISGIDKLPGGVIELPSELGGFTVEGIDDWAFKNNNLINQIIIPSTIKKIGDGAFSGCSMMLSVIIPEGLVHIGWDAFSNCTSLRSIQLPDTVISIGGFAFSGCSSLHTAKLGSGVASIGSFAFEKCTSLKMVYLPQKLERIGISAFAGCDELKDIFYPSSKLDMARINQFPGTFSKAQLWHYNNSEEGVKAGDTDGNGFVNNKDITRLFKYLSGWNVAENYDKYDLNADSKVNNKDLTLLFRYLSGFAVLVY